MLDPGGLFPHTPPAMVFAPVLSQMWPPTPATALLALAAVSLYVASRAAADALAGGDSARTGLRALGHCLPAAITAMVCLHPSMARSPENVAGVAGGRPEIAVGVLFANCVACLTLVLGVISYVAPRASAHPTRKAWPFVLPAALICMLAGFSGRLSWWHAVMLAGLGAAVMNLWVGGEDDSASMGGTSPSLSPNRPRGIRWSRSVQLALAIALSVVGGWAAARGAVQAEVSTRALTAIVLAGTVIGPLLTLPVLGSTSQLAERGEAGASVATLVAIVLINLCGVLPAVVFVHYALTGFSPAVIAAATQPVTELPAYDLRAVPFPLISWRIDTVILLVLGFALIPLSLGRWALGRIEAGVLIFGYALYLAMVALLSTRRY